MCFKAYNLILHLNVIELILQLVIFRNVIIYDLREADADLFK